MRTLLVLPTYNERENVGLLLPELRALVPEADVLVVDDRSPDGTAAVVEAAAARLGRIHLLLRERKDGLGRAYVAGFQWALQNGYEAIVQMDADFSHRPVDLPKLLAALDGGADVVVGSRYIPGGGTEGWAWPRRLISRAGNAYARIVLGVSVRDMTGGFTAWRRSALERIRYETTDSRGYAFQVELKYRALVAGLTLREVPILFPERAYGASKMTSDIVCEAAWGVLRLRLRAAGAVAVPVTGAEA